MPVRGGEAFRILVACVGAALAALGVWSARADAQGSSVSECPVGADDLPDWCLDMELPGEADAGDGGRRQQGGDDDCGWERVSEGDLPQEEVLVEISVNGIPPDGEEVVWYAYCPSPGGEELWWWEWLRWVPVADAPTAEDVAEDLAEAIQGQMPDPDVVTDPPAGVDAIINVPVFVTVENWTDELVETRPLGGETVTVRATPELVFDTGEQELAPVACGGPGRPYDPNSGDLWDQAAAGDACAHPYTLRTGVEGRPEQWPSTVTVRWSITWSATSSEGGAFPAVDRTVSIPRGVVEVPAIVVSGGE